MIYQSIRDLRAAFWHLHPHLPRRRIRIGNTLTYRADTRVAWVDWIDSLHRAGMISSALANRATLER